MTGPSPSDALGEDRRIAGRYRLIRPIASGGMARVWEADDEVLTRSVAVKLLHPHLAADDSFVARFRAEAVSAARLAHPAIVSIYDTWSGDGTEAIVMELVAGTTLRHLIEVRAPLEIDEAVVIADHVAAALEAAHRAGIVHRDIKPANVLLSSDGRVLVTDFGIAKAAEGARPHDRPDDARAPRSTWRPSRSRAAPVDGRADIYALGVVLYEMVCGRPPFQADTDAATALARLHRDPEAAQRGPARASRRGSSARSSTASSATRTAGPASATEVRRRLASRDAPPASARAPVATAAAATVTGDAGRSRIPSTPARGRRGARAAVAAGPHGAGAGRSSRCSGPARSSRRCWRRASAWGRTIRRPSRSRSPPRRPSTPRATRQATSTTPRRRSPPTATAATVWTTETYRDPAVLGKRGVGLVVQFDEPVRIDTLRVTSDEHELGRVDLPHRGGGRAPTSSRGAIRSRPRRASAPRSPRSTLDGRRARAVLIWITRMGDDGRVVIAEVRCLGLIGPCPDPRVRSDRRGRAG